MVFTFQYPVYAFVESSDKDSSGTTTFENPLAIICTATACDPPLSLEAIPIFTDDPRAFAFHRAHEALHKRRLRIKTHDHLIDFLSKVRSRVQHVAIDPLPKTLTSDHLWTIEEVLAAVRAEAEKLRPR